MTVRNLSSRSVKAKHGGAAGAVEPTAAVSGRSLQDISKLTLIPADEDGFIRWWEEDRPKIVKGTPLSDLQRLLDRVCAKHERTPPRDAAMRRGGLSESGAPPPSRLEQEGRKVTLPEKGSSEGRFVAGVSCSCKSWMCEHCREVKGIALRQAILSIAHVFRIPRLYTITVNRSWFKCPKEAYQHIMGSKFIARLLTKEMKVRRWIWVLESQEESGDGWPHWHILIDIADLPGKWYNRSLQATSDFEPSDKTGWHFHPHFLYLKKVHRLLRKWKVGEQCELSLKRGKFSDALHAINYITKYLIKMPRRGFPPWMLETPGIRFYQPSHDVGSILSGGKRRDDDGEGSGMRRKGPRKPIERVSECKTKLAFLEFDEERGGYSFSKPSWGTKESLIQFPGAVWITKFDLRNGRAYKQYGLVGHEACLDFQTLWESPELVESMKSQVEERKLSLLSAWNGSKARDAGEASASRLDSLEPPRDFSSRPPHFTGEPKRADGVESPARPSASGGRRASVGGEGSPPAVAAGEAFRTGASKARFASTGAEGKSRQSAFPHPFFKTA